MPTNGHPRPELRIAPAADPASIPCGQCGTANPRERKFCSQCGKSLWRPCDACGEVNAVAENFCGACGANVRVAVQDRTQQFDRVLQEAGKCRDEAQFPKALALLRAAIKEHQGQLDGHVDRARQLMQQYAAEQQRRLAEAEASFQQALQLVANHAYENAQALLEEVPAALRNEAIEHLLGEVRSKRNEVLALSGEIRQAVAEKKVLDLMPKLERLIELQPKHQQARELAAQLRLRLLEAAKKQIARHKYQEALDLARRVPALLRDKDDENVTVQAAELAWLTADLQTAPVVDETLAAVAERLHTLAPTNPQADRLLEEVRQRAGKRGKDPRFPAVGWAAAPQRCRFGVPVQWLGGFGRLHNESLLESPAYRRCPGVFFVACGLALQGLEKAAVQLNLAPKKKAGLIGFSLLKRKRAVQTAWGLDVGDTALKAVKLKCDDAGKLTLEICDRVEYKKPLSQPDAEQKRNETVREAIEELFKRHPREADRLCVSLPGAKMLGRQFDLPAVKGKKIQDAVEFEAVHQIPYPLSDLIWDFQLMDDPGRDAQGSDGQTSDKQAADKQAADKQANDKQADVGGRQHHVLMVAAKDYQVTDLLSLFEHMDLNVDVVQSSCIALHNYICHDFFDDPQQPFAADDAIVALDVGSEASNVVVSSRNRVWFRGLRLGAGDVTRLIMKQFKLSHAQAEQLKHKPQQARRFSQLYEALGPLLDETAAELERSIGMAQKVYPKLVIKKVLGVGGGFQLHGLHRHLLHGEQQAVFAASEE